MKDTPEAHAKLSDEGTSLVKFEISAFHDKEDRQREEVQNC